MSIVARKIKLVDRAREVSYSHASQVFKLFLPVSIILIDRKVNSVLQRLNYIFNNGMSIFVVSISKQNPFQISIMIFTFMSRSQRHISHKQHRREQ